MRKRPCVMDNGHSVSTSGRRSRTAREGEGCPGGTDGICRLLVDSLPNAVRAVGERLGGGGIDRLVDAIHPKNLHLVCQSYTIHRLGR